MVFVIFALVLGFGVGIVTFYFLFKKMNRKKHWSEGYIMIGDDSIKSVDLSKNTQKETKNSIFPPGW